MRILRGASILMLFMTGAAIAKEKPARRPIQPPAATACPGMGEGYVRAAGSDTCIRVSGSMRMQGSLSISR